MRIFNIIKIQASNRLADQHLKEMVIGSIVTFMIRIAGIGATYLLFFIVARNYGPDMLGIFLLALTVLQIISVIGRLGFDTALLRLVAEYSSCDDWGLVKNIYLKVIGLVLPFSLFLAIILYYFSPQLAHYIFRKEYLSGYFMLASLGLVPIVLFYLNVESLRGSNKINEYAFLNYLSLNLFSLLLLSIYIFLLKEKPSPLLIYMIGTFIASAVSLLLWLNKAKLWSFPPKMKSVGLNKLLMISLPMLSISSIFLIFGWIDTIMLGIYRSESEVGIYNVAFRIASMVALFLITIGNLVAPKYAEFYSKHDLINFEKSVRQSGKLIILTSLPIIIILLIFPGALLGLFGEVFKTGQSAMIMLAVGYFISVICGPVGTLLQMSGKELFFQNVMILAAIVNIALNLFLIPRYGINGAAFSSMFGMMVWNLLSVIYIWKKYRINVFRNLLVIFGKT